MTRYVWWQDGWHEVVPMAPQPRIAIISDTMVPLRHMATGQVMDSKSAFRRATREAGCVELGNDAPVTTTRERDLSLRSNIHQAISELEQGRPAPAAPTVEGPIRAYD